MKTPAPKCRGAKARPVTDVLLSVSVARSIQVEAVPSAPSNDKYNHGYIQMTHIQSWLYTASFQQKMESNMSYRCTAVLTVHTWNKTYQIVYEKRYTPDVYTI